MLDGGTGAGMTTLSRDVYEGALPPSEFGRLRLEGRIFDIWRENNLFTDAAFIASLHSGEGTSLVLGAHLHFEDQMVEEVPILRTLHRTRN